LDELDDQLIHFVDWQIVQHFLHYLVEKGEDVAYFGCLDAIDQVRPDIVTEAEF
jgi:hypothetical protein